MKSACLGVQFASLIEKIHDQYTQMAEISGETTHTGGSKLIFTLLGFGSLNSLTYLRDPSDQFEFTMAFALKSNLFFFIVFKKLQIKTLNPKATKSGF